MIYKVTKRYARGTESLIGTYKTINEAKQVIQANMADDVILKIIATYCLYEGMDLLEEFDQTKLNPVSQTTDLGKESGVQSMGTGQRFSPSPFNTSPQPKGLPRSSWKDDKSDDNDKG